MLPPRPEQQMSLPEWRRRWQLQGRVRVRVRGPEWQPRQVQGPLQVSGSEPELGLAQALPERLQAPGRGVGLQRWPVLGLLPQGAQPCQ